MVVQGNSSGRLCVWCVKTEAFANSQAGFEVRPLEVEGGELER